MPTPAPRPTHDRWRDAEGTQLSLFCRVEQVTESTEPGMLRSRLHQRGEVVGWGTDVLYVRFAGEGHLVGVPPQLLRLLPHIPDEC